MRLSSLLGGLIFGSLAGYLLGVLTAPKAGDQMVKELADVSEDLYRRAAYEIEDLKTKVEDLRAKADEVKGKSSDYLTAVVQSFDPGPHAAVEHAQATLSEHEKTLEASADVLHKAEAPTLTAAVKDGEKELKPEAASELVDKLGAKVSVDQDLQKPA